VAVAAIGSSREFELSTTLRWRAGPAGTHAMAMTSTLAAYARGSRPGRWWRSPTRWASAAFARGWDRL